MSVGGVAGVSTTYNEADVIEACVRHHFAEGFDRLLIADASTDHTTEILHGLRNEFGKEALTIVRDDTDHHFQPRWINRLAFAAGTEWVVPFDADEFWYSPLGTIVEALESVPAGVSKLPARMWQHTDWEHRMMHPAPHPKTAFRWMPEMRVSNGNHYVDGPGAVLWGVLDLRELHFRSCEHMVRKVLERTDRIDPSLPVTDGAHQRERAAFLRAGGSPEEMWAEWLNQATVFDPIPSAVRVAPGR